MPKQYKNKNQMWIKRVVTLAVSLAVFAGFAFLGTLGIAKPKENLTRMSSVAKSEAKIYANATAGAVLQHSTRGKEVVVDAMTGEINVDDGSKVAQTVSLVNANDETVRKVSLVDTSDEAAQTVDLADASDTARKIKEEDEAARAEEEAKKEAERLLRVRESQDITKTFTAAEPAKYGVLNRITDSCQDGWYDEEGNCINGLGDEREFVRVREANASVGADGGETPENFFNAYSGLDDFLNLEAGKTYEVRVYYHNDAEAKLGKMTDKTAEAYLAAKAKGENLDDFETDAMECGGVTTLHNTRLKMKLPQSIEVGADSVEIGAQFEYDSRAYNEIAQVYDKDFTHYVAKDSLRVRNISGGAIKILYDEMSAKIYNSNRTNGTALPHKGESSIFSTNGMEIGSLELGGGNICACDGYAGYISYTFHTEQTESIIKKEASLDGENYASTITAQPGDTVYYRVTYKNTGTRDLTNVTLRDELPDGVVLTSGTTRMYSDLNPDGILLDDVIGEKGIKLGTFIPGASVTILYQVRVKSNILSDLGCGENSLDNLILVENDQQSKNSSSSAVIVSKTCNLAMPAQFPKAGPVEISTALIAIICLTVGGIYFYRSQTGELIKVPVKVTKSVKRSMRSGTKTVKRNAEKASGALVKKARKKRKT